jgi:hypothetical protein
MREGIGALDYLDQARPSSIGANAARSCCAHKPAKVVARFLPTLSKSIIGPRVASKRSVGAIR